MLTVDGSTMGELQKYTDDVMRVFFKELFHHLILMRSGLTKSMKKIK